MKLRSLPFLFVFLFATFWLLAGCSAQEQTTAGEILVEDPEISGSVSPESEPQVDMLPADEESEPGPSVRTELEATDPTSVALGTGRVTFVEFFAFW